MQLAKAYVDSLPALPEDHHRGDVIDDFLGSFFEGITMPGAWIQSGTDADRSGLKAGQEYRRANPGKLKETMEGFGYNAIESEGMWTSGFEHSGFRPFDQPTEQWWLSYMGLTKLDFPDYTKFSKEGFSVRIADFLSVSGHYGHMNTYDHEFFATKISLSTAANDAQPKTGAGGIPEGRVKNQMNPHILFDVICYGAAALGAIPLLAGPFIGRGRIAPRWVRMALWLLGATGIGWSLLGFVLTFDGGMLSAHSHFVIRLAKTLFAGMDIGVALLLFASGDLIRAFARPKTSGTG